MDEIEELERQVLADIEDASDDAALEEVRVAAVGKKGSISGRMKTLGKMTPRGTPNRRPDTERVEEPRERGDRRASYRPA